MDDLGNPAKTRLLLVEDDLELCELLTGLLGEEGYHVEVASDGQRALHLGLSGDYDVLVIDRGLPVLDGLDLLATLRRKGVATPTLVLSALNDPADRVTGLDAGAEDYLGKPFDVDELLARLRALRRRHLDTARELLIGSWRLNLDTRELAILQPGTTAPVTNPKEGQVVQLSRRECDLLAVLAARPGQVFTRDDLFARVFTNADNPVVVDTYVHYLRRKIGKGIIHTVHGRGYRLGTAATP